jgi:hypothetical protein
LWAQIIRNGLFTAVDLNVFIFKEFAVCITSGKELKFIANFDIFVLFLRIFEDTHENKYGATERKTQRGTHMRRGRQIKEEYGYLRLTDIMQTNGHRGIPTWWHTERKTGHRGIRTASVTDRAEETYT